MWGKHNMQAEITPLGYLLWIIVGLIALLPIIGIGIGLYQSHMEKKARDEAYEKAKKEAYDEIQGRELPDEMV